MSKSKPIELPSTFSQAIYDFLKKAIIRGDYKPGQRIQEKEIATAFTVSSTPVREAFFRLASERYLIINARKEVLVYKATRQEICELYETVKALDCHAMRKALNGLTDDELTKLNLMTRRLEELCHCGDHLKYMDLNIRIHDRVWQGCRNGFIYETLCQLMEKISIFRKTNDYHPFSRPEIMAKSLRDHLRIQDAFERRDMMSLQQVMESHWCDDFVFPPVVIVGSSTAGDGGAG
jgi:DNA-binding GntR family transcriptional regulator